MTTLEVLKAAQTKTQNAQFDIIGYIILSKVRRYLSLSSTVDVEQYRACLALIDPCITELFASVTAATAEASLDFLVYPIDWK